MEERRRSPNNRTLTCSEEDMTRLSRRFKRLTEPVTEEDISGHIIHQDFFEAAPHMPKGFVDLLILDPPYRVAPSINEHVLNAKGSITYKQRFMQILYYVKPMLKPDATIYVCSDWRTSLLVAPLLSDHFTLRNRITWERDKGRGALRNWKNNTEDVWFCTNSDAYTFNVDDVKLKRRVIAPYRREDGTPKDWEESEVGAFRLTFPSNIWTDITIPFWSMPENTDHPTQKPEKLIAKLMLASSNEGDMVLDPFLGSGTSAVVARKLKRRFVGIEQDQLYCCWTMKRLERAEMDNTIQGYADGVFWERNTMLERLRHLRDLERQAQIAADAEAMKTLLEQRKPSPEAEALIAEIEAMQQQRLALTDPKTDVLAKPAISSQPSEEDQPNPESE